MDLVFLMKVRLVVARFGEMDVAGWWNTRGVLGRHGDLALGRGFPVTHFFAQAAIVFAVARARCNELFNPPQCVYRTRFPGHYFVPDDAGESMMASSPFPLGRSA